MIRIYITVRDSKGTHYLGIVQKLI